jgi:hypothetical protein
MDTATAAAIEAVKTHQGSCWLCGDPVHRVPQGDEWAWAGQDGKTTGSSTDLRSLLEHYASPYDRLAELAGQMDVARKAKRAELTPLYWAAAREYSALKVRLDTGMSFHIHQVTAQRGHEHRGPLPWHCGWPMRLTPAGWACRRCAHRQDTVHSLEASR